MCFSADAFKGCVIIGFIPLRKGCVMLQLSRSLQSMLGKSKQTLRRTQRSRLLQPEGLLDDKLADF